MTYDLKKISPNYELTQKFVILKMKKNYLSSSTNWMSGISMLGSLTIKAVNSCLAYKGTKVMIHAMEVLYKNDKLFHNRFKVLKIQHQYCYKPLFDLEGLQTRLNSHDKTYIQLTNISSTF